MGIGRTFRVGGADRRRCSRGGDAAPAQYPGAPPPPPPFNPFWLCCKGVQLCCPALHRKTTDVASRAADSILDGLVSAAAAVISFACGRLLLSLGPLVAVLALGIIGQLAFTFFTIILPMLSPEPAGVASWPGAMHASWIVFLLVNILFNYARCVVVKQPGYDAVVRELAVATGFKYPESDAEILACKKQFYELMQHRRGAYEQESHAHNTPADDGNSTLRKRVGTKTTSPEPNATPKKDKTHDPPMWMLLGPEEWGFCTRSNQPKPPRSHFDGATKQLVLNLDHFCPWTFNVVGYFNYRHFVTFLVHVEIAMVYALFIGYQPFVNGYASVYEQQIEMSKAAGHATTLHLIPFTPTPEEKGTVIVAYTFVILTFLGVGNLLWHHLHQIFSAQTTIEKLADRARLRSGEALKSPYSLGPKENWRMVFGSGHPLLALLPSWREPDFLPLPVNGKLVARGAPKNNPSNSAIQGHCIMA